VFRRGVTLDVAWFGKDALIDRRRLYKIAHSYRQRQITIGCDDAEAKGVENFHLYEWTKKTIDDPAKKAKYTKSFALYIGGDEVYEKDKADALEAELKPLVGGPIVAKMFKYDTDPAHNPQPPRQRQNRS
jgi:hypothetical protein